VFGATLTFTEELLFHGANYVRFAPGDFARLKAMCAEDQPVEAMALWAARHIERGMGGIGN
jgi:hypothetical protein